MKLFDGKVALVTGGSRGIGKAIVLELTKLGAKVIFTYVSSDEKAMQLENETAQLGVRAFACKSDIRNNASCELLVQEIKKKFGTIDFLVNNAGIIRDKSLALMSDSDWYDVLDTNLGGVFRLTRAVLPLFLRQKAGSIVNISSVAGLSGSRGQTNYSSSKAGVIGFTKSLAKEIASSGIRVNAVAPGFILTEMITDVTQSKREDLCKVIPMRRFGSASEVSNVVIYLLSDQASYVTGHVFPVDGGLAI